MASNKYYELLQEVPDRFEPIAELFSWGENYTFKDSPVRVFLHLIGWMADAFGDKDLEAVPVLGYLELDLLGKALTAYAEYGEEAYNWVSALMEADLQDDDYDLQLEEDN